MLRSPCLSVVYHPYLLIFVLIKMLRNQHLRPYNMWHKPIIVLYVVALINTWKCEQTALIPWLIMTSKADCKLCSVKIPRGPTTYNGSNLTELFYDISTVYVKDSVWAETWTCRAVLASVKNECKVHELFLHQGVHECKAVKRLCRETFECDYFILVSIEIGMLSGSTVCSWGKV